jgi:hypothetical protein
MNPLKTHDLLAVILVIGGLPITGYGEEGAIAFEPLSPIGESKVSADGKTVVFSRNNDPRVLCRITVMRNSRAYQLLASLYQAQKAQETILPMPFAMKNWITGAQVTEEYAVFQQVPIPSQEKTAGEDEWEILLPNARDQVLHAPNVLI